MSERFLCAIATFDKTSEQRIQRMQERLTAAGFVGNQTQGIPHHITLQYYPPEHEAEVEAMVAEVVSATKRFALAFNSFGLFALNVLFLAPDVNYALLDLHNGLSTGSLPSERGWTPHATILIDEPKTVLKALPLIGDDFAPFIVTIEGVQLYEFFPARLIGSYMLR